MTDRLGAMQQFVRVVETGSFSAAARQLRQGQPAVSKAIAQLEVRLGASLLTRTTRKVVPTEAGRSFYARAVAALDAVEEAEAAARASTRALAGTLKVCMPVTLARLHIVPRLGGFLAMHPNVTLDLALDDRRVDLVGEGIDVAIRAGPLDDSNFVASRLASAERLVIATPDWVARHSPLDHPSELVAAAPIIYGTARNWIFTRGGITELVDLKRGLAISAAEGQRAAVLAGLGPTIASSWIFADTLANGQTVRLLPNWTLPEVEVWVLTPSGRHVNAKTRAFIAFVRKLFDTKSARSTR